MSCVESSAGSSHEGPHGFNDVILCQPVVIARCRCELGTDFPIIARAIQCERHTSARMTAETPRPVAMHTPASNLPRIATVIGPHSFLTLLCFDKASLRSLQHLQ